MSLNSDGLVCLDMIVAQIFLLLLLIRANSFKNMLFLTTALLTLILPISIQFRISNRISDDLFRLIYFKLIFCINFIVLH